MVAAYMLLGQRPRKVASSEIRKPASGKNALAPPAHPLGAPPLAPPRAPPLHPLGGQTAAYDISYYQTSLKLLEVLLLTGQTLPIP